ncbi:MAG: HAMP domain-containing sensor histidine kinase [Candidatus Gastranaerophilales bacterium]|nr:HAMP domain-containing sensor histidine kinase [Candidatus Gastranaerophilales bacterium]
MERMDQEREQHILSVGVKQLEHTTKQYLRIKESFILEKLQNLSPEKISLKKVQEIFKTDKVEWIYGKNIDKVTSYYEITQFNPSEKPSLYGVSIIPFEVSGIKGIKIFEKVDLNQLRPAGPFDLKIYLGTKISKNTLLGIVHDPMFNPDNGRMHMMPPPPDNNRMHPPPDEYVNSPENIRHSEIKITDNNGKTVATILIKTGKPPRHLGPPSPIENQFGLIILLAGSVLSLLIGFYINKNFISPLLLLSNASKQVQKGNLSIELNTNIKHDQILNTFKNFNQMVKGLKEKEDLRKSFITNLTHDLKTPLIAQERSLELISKEFESLGLKDAYELATGIEKNNKHLLRMVNLILESYRFDSENLNLIISNINISELIDSCYTKLKPLASEKNIQLLNTVPKDFPLLNGDATSFKRVFLNLISNAIESITQLGKIKISAESYENNIKIYIKDNGPGIAQEELNYLFERYYTGKSDERKLGSGLGLYVCKKLVEIHNGEISVESKVNDFTKFIIKLPLNFQKYEDKK